jgi:hypothetical protein
LTIASYQEDVEADLEQWSIIIEKTQSA